MRKISTLFTMLFLLCGVCMAQSSRLVYLKTVGRGDNGRYMSVNAAGGLGSVAEKDNSALWVLNPVAGKADTYTLRNASNAGYVQAVWAFENQWKTVANASDASELVLEDMGDGTFGLRKADAATGSSYYAHLAGDMARIVMWYAGDGNAASRWKVEDVEGELKATVLANVEYLSKVQAAVANAEMNYANTLPSNFVKTGEAMITDVSQILSNAPQNPVLGNNGGQADGQGYDALIDGNYVTYFHTRWGGTPIDEDHYLQITLPESPEPVYDYVAEFVTRNLQISPTVVNVYGAVKVNDQLVWDDDPFTTVSMSTSDWTNLGSQYKGSIPAIQTTLTGRDPKNYAALRFSIAATNTGDAYFGLGHPCFAYAEFNVYAGISTVPPKYNEVTEEDRVKLYEAIQLANDLDVTKDDFKAVYEQITAMVAEVRDNIGGESLDLLLVIDEAKAKLEALTTYENTPGQLDEEGKAAWDAAIAAAQEVYDAYDKNDQHTRLNCIEAQCQLERFLAANTKSNVTVDVVALTNGFFTIENPNTKRGAIVYAPGQMDKNGNAIVDPSHENFCNDNAAAEYVWYAEVDDVDPTNENHLWGFYQNPENGELYLYNVGSGLFANPNGNGTYGKTWILSQVPSPIKLEAMEAPFVHVLGEGETMSISTSYAGPVITYYADGDEGVPFQFKRVGDSNTSIPDWSEVEKRLYYNVSRPHLIDPLRGYIDFLWDMMASEKEHSAEPGHLNAVGLATLDEVIAWANEQANFLVITDHYEDAAAVLAGLKASTAAIYAAAANYTKPENGKYYTIKSNNSSDGHYHLAHFLIQNAANDFLVVANSTGEFEKTAWLAKENDDKTFSFTNNGRYLAFGKTVADPYKWTLGAPQRSDVFENDFGCLSLYGVGDSKYLAVNAKTSSIIEEMPTRYDDNVPDVKTGETVRDGSVTTTAYSSLWRSADGLWTFSTTANNMKWVNNEIGCWSGKLSGSWTVASTAGQTISQIKLTVAMNGSGHDYTIEANGQEYKITAEEQEITIQGSSFNLKGDNGAGMLLKKLVVTTATLEPVQADFSTDFIFEQVEPSNSGDVEGGTTVGIDTIFNESAQDVYTLSGVLVRKQATNLNGLPKGVYVVGGQKVLVK